MTDWLRAAIGDESEQVKASLAANGRWRQRAYERLQGAMEEGAMRVLGVLATATRVFRLALSVAVLAASWLAIRQYGFLGALIGTVWALRLSAVAIVPWLVVSRTQAAPSQRLGWMAWIYGVFASCFALLLVASVLLRRGTEVAVVCAIGLILSAFPALIMGILSPYTARGGTAGGRNQ